MTADDDGDLPSNVVRAMFAESKPIAPPLSVGPDPGQPLNGVPAGKWLPDPATGLPPGCPVTPLGHSGNTGFFIDPSGQIQAFAKPYGRADIGGLFLGDTNYIIWAWPSEGKRGVDDFEAKHAFRDLLLACKRKGIWEAVEKIFGRGAWAGRSGALLLHVGNDLIAAGRTRPTGAYENAVYPTRPAIPAPWPEKISASESPARLLLPLLRSWNWERPEVDAILLLGWIGAAFLGGALPWRSAVFITGDKATGKSTLQHLIKLLFGEWLVQAADTSAAGIYQRLGQDSLPVAVDELESESDVRRQKAVLKLARLAASGALMLRGGDRHQGIEFLARSCFLFSSINAPPLEPQDLSRMALLKLRRLSAGQAAPVLDPQQLAMQGRMLLRRLVDQWSRFSETFAAYRGELAAGGMDGRGQDTFGVLLTCYDLLMHDGWDDERLRHPTADGELVLWRELLCADTMAEFEDAAENWRLCLDHLLSVPVEAWRGGTRKTVGQVINEYLTKSSEMSLTEARTLLSQAGLTIVMREQYLQQAWLAVPNQNPLTRNLFAGSKWAGEIGASVWANALRQGPRETIDVGWCRISGVKCRATLVNFGPLYAQHEEGD